VTVLRRLHELIEAARQRRASVTAGVDDFERFRAALARACRRGDGINA
jgi:hypothetical protein